MQTAVQLCCIEVTIPNKNIIPVNSNAIFTPKIADRLKFRIRTIEGYREKIQEKMDVRNTAGIVFYAIKECIYEIGSNKKVRF